MKKPILLFFIVCTNGLLAQSNFHEFKADSLKNNGLLKDAISEYFKAYAKDKLNKQICYKYACALALDKQIDSAFHYLFIAIKGDTSVAPLNDSHFYYLIDDPRWGQLEDTLVSWMEKKGYNYPNKELSKELWRMKIIDQSFYYHLDVLEKKSSESFYITAIWELKDKLNQVNLKRLRQIIDSVGWVTKSMVGGKGAISAFLIIQHADLVTQKKYLPIIIKAADEGEADWMTLALLIDRINVREGKPQIYGSQVTRNTDGTYYVNEIENPEFVNQRRAKIGLPPIEDYVSNWGITWTVKQKTK